MIFRKAAEILRASDRKSSIPALSAPASQPALSPVPVSVSAAGSARVIERRHLPASFATTAIAAASLPVSSISTSTRIRSAIVLASESRPSSTLFSMRSTTTACSGSFQLFVTGCTSGGGSREPRSNAAAANAAANALSAAAISLAVGEGTSGRCFNVRTASRGGCGGGLRTFRPVLTRARTLCQHVSAAGLGVPMPRREALPDATSETATGFAPPRADFVFSPQTAALELAGGIDLMGALRGLAVDRGGC